MSRRSVTKSVATETKRVAIYTRKSTTMGLEQEFNSLDAQRDSCLAYIQRQPGWKLVDEHYDDGGFTGANIDRPAFTRLMADVEACKVDVIVVYKVDRLSRSLLDFMKVMERLTAVDASFVSVTQNFSTADAMGRLTMNMLMSFAEFEREMIRCMSSCRATNAKCCERHRLFFGGACAALTREQLGAVADTHRALHSDAVSAGDPERVEINRMAIELAELLAEHLPATLPTRRESFTQSARLGSTSLDVSVSRVEGRVVEVFVDVNHKEGAPLVGIGHAIARLASLALQAGTPIEAVIRALAGTGGGAGEVQGVDGVERAESLFDLVAKLLEREAGK